MILEVHPGVACPLNCTFCYRRGHNYENGNSVLNIQRLQTLIVEFAAQGGRQLNISGGLEPFTRSEAVISAVQSAHACGLRTWIYTNGLSSALEDSDTCEILIQNTDRIRFSIHAIDAQTYLRVARPQKPDITLARVIEIVWRLLRTRSKPCPEIGIDFIVTSENASELVDAAIFWRYLGVDFLDVRFDVTATIGPDERTAQAVEQLRGRIQSGHVWPLRVNIGTYEKRRPFASKCWAPEQKLVIDPFGLVWPCCMLAHPGFRYRKAQLGDINTSNLGDIIRRVGELFPMSHCSNCTPWEADYNARQEKKANLHESVPCY